MPECPTCGAVCAPGANFCASCGGDLRAPARPAAAGEDATEAVEVVEETVAIALDAAAISDDPTDPDLPVVAVTAPAPRLVTCPACGAPNAARRRSCGRCQADLGDVVPDPEPTRPIPRPSLPSPPPSPPAPVTARPSARTEVDDTAELEVVTIVPGGGGPPRARRRWLPASIVAVGLLVGAGLGGAAVAGLGPFGGAPLAATFDATVYPDDPEALVPATAGASSLGPGGADGEHSPNRVADRSLATAWRSADGATTGVLLELRYPEPAWVTDVVIAVGDQSSPEAFAEAARPARVLLHFDGDRPLRLTLLDVTGEQSVRLDLARLVGTLRVEVEAVHGDGAAVAVTELRAVGHVATAADASAWFDRYG